MANLNRLLLHRVWRATKAAARKTLVLLLAVMIRGSMAWSEPGEFRVQSIEEGLQVGYAVNLVDMDADSDVDVVVVDSKRVLWYENPTWQRHTVIEGITKPDNVCVAPWDIDGDGAVDLALGADWRPFDTNTGGTIQWISREKSANEWRVFPIGEEPTVHRMRWVDLQGNGRPDLVVVPLMGRGTTRPMFAEQGVRILAYSIPENPRAQPWPVRTIDDSLHVCHNFFPTDLNRDGKQDLIVVSFEGVFLLEQDGAAGWKKSQLGTGNQATSPERGASEIKSGLLAGDRPYLATIEPWHGFQVVVYTQPKDSAGEAAQAPLWDRRVLDEQLKWGHAVWCANLDDDPDEELIIGVRDDQDAQWRSGVRIYDPPRDLADEWKRTILDPGGVAVEDLAVQDLNGDGRMEIVVSGRQTHNVRIYWNETGKSGKAP